MSFNNNNYLMHIFKVLTLTENGVKEISTSNGHEGSFVFVNGKNGKFFIGIRIKF